MAAPATEPQDLTQDSSLWGRIKRNRPLYQEVVRIVFSGSHRKVKQYKDSRSLTDGNVMRAINKKWDSFESFEQTLLEGFDCGPVDEVPTLNWDDPYTLIFGCARGTYRYEIQKGDLSEIWGEIFDKYSEDLCGIKPKSYNYHFTFGAVMEMSGDIWQNEEFLKDLALAMQGDGIKITAETPNVHELNVFLSMFKERRGGTPTNRLDKLMSTGRIKVMPLAKMMAFLNIKIQDYGHIQFANDIQNCLRQSEKEMQDLFNATILNKAINWSLIHPVSEISLDAESRWGEALDKSESVYDAYGGDYETCVVHKVTGFRNTPDGREFEVYWEGFETPTWEPACHIPDDLRAPFDEQKAEIDEDGDIKVADPEAPRLSLHNSSTVKDEHNAKPDLCVWIPTGSIVMKLELMSASRCDPAYLCRVLDYGAQVLQSNPNQGFSVNLLIAGASRFYVIVCFTYRGRFRWLRTPPLKLSSVSTKKRFADVFLSLMTRTPRELGYYPPQIGPLRLENCIGVGGESCVFSAMPSTQPPRRMEFALSRLHVVTPADSPLLAVKFWRRPEDYRMFRTFMATMRGVNMDHAISISDADFNDTYCCARMPIGLDCQLCCLVEPWVDLAEWLWEFHKQSNHVHGDISPGNIVWMPESKKLVLIDWGSVVREGMPLTKKSRTTLSVLPEIANETVAKFWHDNLMLLRSIAMVLYACGFGGNADGMGVDASRVANKNLSQERFLFLVRESFAFKTEREPCPPQRSLAVRPMGFGFRLEEERQFYM